jgi:hypothetical protein
MKINMLDIIFGEKSEQTSSAASELRQLLLDALEFGTWGVAHATPIHTTRGEVPIVNFNEGGSSAQSPALGT